MLCSKARTISVEMFPFLLVLLTSGMSAQPYLSSHSRVAVLSVELNRGVADPSRSLKITP